MRISIESSPFLGLVCLPILAAYLKLHMVAVCFILLSLFVLWRVMVQRSSKKLLLKPLKVESIVPSHFCEKVRWTMEHCGIPFEEEFDMGLFGVFVCYRFVPILRDYKSGSVVRNSSNILRYLYGLFSCKSVKVEEFLRPSQEALALESMFDNVLGRAVQVCVYYSFIEQPGTHQSLYRLWGGESSIVPLYQRWFVRLFFPLILKFLTRGLNLTHDNFLKSLTKIEETFQTVNKRLADGRKYLMGDAPSFVDITFASLAGPLLMNGETYCNGLVSDSFVPPDKIFGAGHVLSLKIAELRNSKAGEFVKFVYDKHRNTSVDTLC